MSTNDTLSSHRPGWVDRVITRIQSFFLPKFSCTPGGRNAGKAAICSTILAVPIVFPDIEEFLVLARVATIVSYLMWAKNRTVGSMCRASLIGVLGMMGGVVYVTLVAMISANKWVMYSAIIVYTFLSASYPTTEQFRLVIIHLSRVAVYGQAMVLLDIHEGNQVITVPWSDVSASSCTLPVVMWMCTSGLLSLLMWPIVSILVTSNIRPAWAYHSLQSDLQASCDRVSETLTQGSDSMTTANAEQCFKNVLTKLDLVSRSTIPAWYEAVLQRDTPRYFYMNLTCRSLKRMVGVYNFFQRMYMQACQASDDDPTLTENGRPNHRLLVTLLKNFGDFMVLSAEFVTHLKNGMEYVDEDANGRLVIYGWTRAWESQLIEICRNTVRYRTKLRRSHVQLMNAWDVLRASSSVSDATNHVPTNCTSASDKSRLEENNGEQEGDLDSKGAIDKGTFLTELDTVGMQTRRTTMPEFHALYSLLYVGSKVPEDICDLILRLREQKRACGHLSRLTKYDDGDDVLAASVIGNSKTNLSVGMGTDAKGISVSMEFMRYTTQPLSIAANTKTVQANMVDCGGLSQLQIPISSKSPSGDPNSATTHPIRHSPMPTSLVLKTSPTTSSAISPIPVLPDSLAQTTPKSTSGEDVSVYSASNFGLLNANPKNVMSCSKLPIPKSDNTKSCSDTTNCNVKLSSSDLKVDTDIENHAVDIVMRNTLKSEDSTSVGNLAHTENVSESAGVCVLDDKNEGDSVSMRNDKSVRTHNEKGCDKEGFCKNNKGEPYLNFASMRSTDASRRNCPIGRSIPLITTNLQHTQLLNVQTTQAHATESLYSPRTGHNNISELVCADDGLVNVTMKYAWARSVFNAFRKRFDTTIWSSLEKDCVNVYRRYSTTTFLYSLRLTLIIVPFCTIYYVDVDNDFMRYLHGSGTYYAVLMSISSLASIEHIVLGASFIKGQNRLAGNILGCCIALVVNMTVFDNGYALLFMWFVMSMVSIYMFDYAALPAAQLYMASGFLSGAIRISTHPTPLETAAYLLTTTMGCVVSILATIFVFPNRATDAVLVEVADDLEVCADYILQLVNCVVNGRDLSEGLERIGEAELYERLSNVVQLSKLAENEPKVPMARPHDAALTDSLKELVSEITISTLRMLGAVRYMSSKPAKSHERYTRTLASPMLEVAFQINTVLQSYAQALREGQLVAKKASIKYWHFGLEKGPLAAAYSILRDSNKVQFSNDMQELENELLDEHWVHPATLIFMLNLEGIADMVSNVDSFRIQ